MRDQNYAVVEATRNLNVSAQELGRWIKEAENDDGHTFRGNGKLMPEQNEIRKLKTQVKRLEIEREILKKRRSSLQRKRSKILVCYPT
jgi:transposase